MIQQTHILEKCLKDVREVTSRADLWGLLENPHGENKDKKRHEDRECEREEEQFGLGERSHPTRRTILDASGHGQFEERD